MVYDNLYIVDYFYYIYAVSYFILIYPNFILFTV